MTRAEYDACPKVYCRNGTGYWWQAFPMSWHARANDGQDAAGCRVTARVEGTLLRVQHGPDPEQSKLFSLDELNQIGGCHNDGDPVNRWLRSIHAYLDGRRRGPGRSGGS
jgi:hypothetical protein